MDGGGIRGVSVGNDRELLIGLSGADGLGGGDGCGQDVSGVCEMIGGDFQGLGGDKEEDEVVFALDLDIGFICGADGIDRAFSL